MHLYEQIKREYKQLGPANFCRAFAEMLMPGPGGTPPLVNPWSLSIKGIAESVCGPDWVRTLQPNMLQQTYLQPLRESVGDAVDVSAFSNITGQIVYSVVHQGWDQSGMIGDEIFTTRPTPFDGEKIPGIGIVGKTGYRIHPGMPYPFVGVNEHYWTTPSIYKYGLAIGITKEAVAFDRTGLILQRCQSVGEMIRFQKEDRQLACLAGITVQMNEPDDSFNGNNHVWNGTSYNTYATMANAIGINSLASNKLIDWTSINALNQLAQQLTHPDTGRALAVNPNTLVVMPKNEFTANRIVTATTVRTAYPSVGTSGAAAPGNVIFDAPNPIKNVTKVLKSARLRQLVIAAGEAAAKADEWWFYLQSGKPFLYMENWPFMVVQAPPNNPAEFERDVVAMFKAGERGQPYSADPRYTFKSYDTTDL